MREMLSTKVGYHKKFNVNVWKFNKFLMLHENSNNK